MPEKLKGRVHRHRSRCMNDVCSAFVRIKTGNERLFDAVFRLQGIPPLRTTHEQGYRA